MTDFLILLLWALTGWLFLWRRRLLTIPNGSWGGAPSGLQTLAIVAVFLVVQFFILGVTAATKWSAPVALLGGLLTTLLVARRMYPEVLWGPGNPRQSIQLGAATWLVAFPTVSCLTTLINYLLTQSFDIPPIDQIAVRELKDSLSEPWRFAMLVFAVVILAPLAEEIIFRGYVQSWLRNRLGASAAIVGASLIFAAFHFSPDQGYTNIELLSALFLLSCILGWLYERQRSLWAPIALHCVFNTITVIIIYLNWD